MSKLSNTYRLGVKELWSLARDPGMLLLIAFTFSISIYSAGSVMPESLHRTPILSSALQPASLAEHQ